MQASPSFKFPRGEHATWSALLIIFQGAESPFFISSLPPTCVEVTLGLSNVTRGHTPYRLSGGEATVQFAFTSVLPHENIKDAKAYCLFLGLIILLRNLLNFSFIEV